MTRPGGLTRDDLDREVEHWLRSVWHRDIDFEIEDTLAKLRGLDLVESAPLLRSRPLPEALARLTAAGTVCSGTSGREDRSCDQAVIVRSAAAVPLTER